MAFEQLQWRDVIRIHSPSLKRKLTKARKYPVDFIKFDSFIFRDMITEQEPDPTKVYYHHCDVLEVLGEKESNALNFIRSIEDPLDDTQGYLF